MRLMSSSASGAAHPAHNGLEATPGVVARLAALEKLGEKLVDETQPNGGNSLRDVVHRTSLDVAAIKDEQGRLRAQIEKGKQ